MASTDALHHCLYLSRLSPGVEFDVVKDIARSARAHNPPRGITGALLFDGERFCQLLEGPAAEVRDLMARIEADPRHTALVTLHDGPRRGARMLHAWRSGYCESSSDLDVFTGDAALVGAAAVRAFVALAQAADLE